MVFGFPLSRSHFTNTYIFILDLHTNTFLNHNYFDMDFFLCTHKYFFIVSRFLPRAEIFVSSVHRLVLFCG